MESVTSILEEIDHVIVGSEWHQSIPLYTKLFLLMSVAIVPLLLQGK